MIDLDTALLNAHSTGDLAALAALYTQAADHTDAPDAAAFYLTHAHVFALEAGLPESEKLRDRLIEMGRETPL